MIRWDAVLWLLAALIAGLAAGLAARAFRPPPAGPLAGEPEGQAAGRVPDRPGSGPAPESGAGRLGAVAPGPLAMAGLALLGLLAGLAWRSRLAGAAMLASPADGLALLAAAVLGWTLWLALSGASPARIVSYDPAFLPGPALAPATLLAGLAALAAALVAWRGALPAGPALTGGWLPALHAIPAALGLAGWPVVAAVIIAAGLAPAGRVSRRGEVADESAAGQPFALALSRFTLTPLRWIVFWLAVALIAGALVSMAVYATPWRGQPAESWPAVAWLLAGAYLSAVSGRRPDRLHPVLLVLLALLGLAAAILAAWQLPAAFL